MLPLGEGDAAGDSATLEIRGKGRKSKEEKEREKREKEEEKRRKKEEEKERKRLEKERKHGKGESAEDRTDKMASFSVNKSFMLRLFIILKTVSVVSWLEYSP